MKKKTLKYNCPDCEKTISRYAKKCSSCALKSRKVTPKTRNKISDSLMNHFVSEQTIKKQKIAALRRFQDPKEREKVRISHLGKKTTEKTKKLISLSLGGTGIPYENCKLSLAIRYLSKYIQWRTKVFKRDNHTCQKCDKTKCYIEAHHKKSFAKILSEFLKTYAQYSPIEDKETLIRLAIKHKSFWEIDNGQTLCKDCHELTDNYKIKKEKITCLN